MTTTQKKTRIEYTRRRRISKGKCPKCGKEMDRQGYYCITCLAKCNEYTRENRAFWRANKVFAQDVGNVKLLLEEKNASCA